MLHRASLHVPRAPAELPLLEACKAIERAGGSGSKATAASRRARRARRLVAERAVLHTEHERWMHARNKVCGGGHNERIKRHPNALAT